MKRVIKVCKHCGSENVRLDALTEWSVEEQRWVLADVYDFEFCSDCEAEGHSVIIEKEITDAQVPDPAA